MFILRQKTTDEIADDGSSFGTHKLINVKARHLGKDIAGACEPVQVDDNLRKNFINLQFKNFNITGWLTDSCKKYIWRFNNSR